MDIFQKFSEFYQQLEKDSLPQLGEIYSDDVVFVDPVSEHHGLPSVERYFRDLMESTTLCKSHITRLMRNDDTAAFCWTMELAHPKLNGGKPFEVHGSTWIQVRDDKIVFHRDYFDLGQMAYERIPVLGRLVRIVKRRLAS